jgi:hypothetical protein
MTFTLPGPTPDTYWECYHEFIAQTLPLPVKFTAGEVAFEYAKSPKVITAAVVAGKVVLIGNAARLTKSGRQRIIKVRRRAMSMKADRATFRLIY